MQNLDQIDAEIAKLERKIRKGEEAKREARHLYFLLEANSVGYVWGRQAKKTQKGQRTGYKYKKTEEALRLEYQNRTSKEGNSFDTLFSTLFKLAH